METKADMPEVFYSVVVKDADTVNLIARLRADPANRISGPEEREYLISLGDIPEVEFRCCQVYANTSFHVRHHYKDAAYVPFLERLITHLRKCGFSNEMSVASDNILTTMPLPLPPIDEKPIAPLFQLSLRTVIFLTVVAGILLGQNLRRRDFTHSMSPARQEVRYGWPEDVAFYDPPLKGADDARKVAITVDLGIAAFILMVTYGISEVAVRRLSAIIQEEESKNHEE